MKPPVYGDREALLRDHATELELYKILVDIRFKLLTFVPTVTTIAVGILSLDKQKAFDEGTTFLVGLGGAFTSLAIVVYEIRNSQIHDRVIHRIKHLERLLGFTPSYAGRSPRGMFGERGKGERLFGIFFSAQHDRALSIVYGVVLALWTWAFLTGLGVFVGWFDGEGAAPGPRVKDAISGIIGFAVAVEINRQGGIGREPAIIYTLDDTVCEADRRDMGKPRTNGGERIWGDLNEVQKKAKSSPKSLHDLIVQMGNAYSSGNGAKCANKLVNLAIASGMINVRQKIWPPWNPRGRREQALKVTKNIPIPSPESLSRAIVGGQEVLECLRANTGMRRGITLARDTLMQRYGSDAPWCSSEEIRLRWELLSAASRTSVASRMYGRIVDGNTLRCRRLSKQSPISFTIKSSRGLTRKHKDVNHFAHEDGDQRSASDYLELWKHYAAFGGEDKNRMVTIASYILGVSAAVLGVIVSLLKDDEWITFKQPQQAVMFSALGIIISGIAAYTVLLYAGYSNQNWQKADDIARDRGWSDLLPQPSQDTVGLRPLVRIGNRLAEPCEPRSNIAPVFRVFAALSILFFLMHLIIIIRSISLILVAM
ncbi:hypothetical protein ACX80V_17160 [Arthrobacter sp. MDT3-24]